MEEEKKEEEEEEEEEEVEEEEEEEEESEHGRISGQKEGTKIRERERKRERDWRSKGAPVQQLPCRWSASQLDYATMVGVSCFCNRTPIVLNFVNILSNLVFAPPSSIDFFFFHVLFSSFETGGGGKEREGTAVQD